jgi:chromosome segregation ATPase
MANEPTSEVQGATDSESFEQWLDQAAESKGVSRQELMNQMLSSYWILDELTGLIDETGARGDRGFDGSAGATDGEAEAEDVAEADGSMRDDDETTAESIRDIQTAIRELVESQNQTLDERRRTDEGAGERPAVFDEGIVAVVSDLQRQVGRFDGDLEEIEDRQDTQFDRLSNEIQLLLDRVNELERDQDRLADAEEVAALAGGLEELKEQVREVRAANEGLESRVDREFDSIEELFRRLLDAIDDLDSDLDAATQTYRSELEPIQERVSERDALKALKEEALRREIRHGSCESCDLSVDLALLESPDCPNCTARFTGIDDTGWNPFRSPTLETGPADGV